ncbi:MAG: type II secretion system protein GspL [Myxococcota bacterium]|jgi:general secretion pathway protein L|nr:type II secretion system protein GspL [Myxococcota bacterium]
MPFNKSIVGLDLGSHAIKSVELQPSLRGGEPAPMHRMAREDLATASPETDPLPEEVERFLGLHFMDLDHVVSAIEGNKISLRRLTFPFRDRKKLSQAIPFAVEGEIPFELEDILIDWMSLTEVGSGGEVLAALTRRENVATRLAQLQAAGVDPRALEAEGLVLGNLSALFDLPSRCLIVDLGHRKTNLALVVNGRAVNAHAVPIAGAAFNKAIANARGCSMEEAEARKCEAQDDALAIFPELDAMIARLCREIVRFLEANQNQTFEDDSSEAPAGIDGAVLVGGSARLAGLEAALETQLGIRTACLGEPREDEQGAILGEGDPVLFAPAIALALRSTSKATSRLDFRQHEFAYRTNYLQVLSQDLRPTAILAATAAALGLLSFGTSLILESSRAADLEGRAQALYNEVLPGGSGGNPVPAMSRALREAQERADFLGIYGTDLSAVDLLAELSRRIPPELKVKFEDINIDRRIVKIKVLGENYQAADRLKALLARVPPFVNAEVDKVKSTRGGAGTRFNLTLNLAAEGEAS